MITFEFIIGKNGATFRAQTEDEAVIAKARAELDLPLNQRNLHIHGPLQRGDGGVNQPWSWQFVANDWDLVEISYRLCHESPDYIEQNLEEWLNTVGTFCPWDSHVNAEI